MSLYTMRILLVMAFFLTLVCYSGRVLAQAAEKSQSSKNEAQKSELRPPKTVTGLMQMRPGGPAEEVEVEVHEVPVDPATVPATEAPLLDDDLVLGVVSDGQAVAYPIRFLAMSEIVDSQVGKTPVAPTW